MSIKDVLTKREQIQQTEEKPFEMLLLKDGDVANIRFIDDDMYEEKKFHVKVQTYPSGKKFTFNIPCVGNNCAYCDSKDEDVSKRKTKIVSWVYVSEIYHNSPDSDGKWVSKKRAGGKPIYVETVDKIMLFFTSVGNKGALSEQILEMYRENGTVSDRYFSWSRKGSKQLDTTYTLVARDKSEFDISVQVPLTLDNVTKYLLSIANESLNFKSKTTVVEEVDTGISEDVQKAVDDALDTEEELF